MNFKLIDTLQLKKIYPNNYDKMILKSYKLYDTDFNTSFKYCYSYYKFYLNKYLNEVLKLNEIEQKIKELSIGLDINYLYKDINPLNFSYIFIRNNIFLDRLSENEINDLLENINKKNFEGIIEIVKDTFFKTIKFNDKYENNADVCYEVDNPKMISKNNALVIGILVNDNYPEEFQNFIKEKEIEYSKILNIPISIFLYQNKDINNNVYSVIDLNALEEEISKEVKQKYPKYLPIGSVVMLKGAWKKIMITGYAPINSETKEIIGDYMACLYPEGIMNADYNILFNHNDIKKIYAVGLVDDEQKQFIKILFEKI